MWQLTLQDENTKIDIAVGSHCANCHLRHSQEPRSYVQNYISDHSQDIKVYLVTFLMCGKRTEGKH